MNTSDFLIGIDAGGTKTRAFAYRAQDFSPIPGSEARSGPGNLTYDTAGAVVSISEAARASAEAAASVTGGLCRHLTVGAAGFSSAGIGSKTADALSRGLRSAVPSGESRGTTLVSDATLALHANFDTADCGMIVIAGTGSAAFMQLPFGPPLPAGGWGNHLGDSGSGWSVSRAAVRALLRMYDAGDAPGAEAFFARWKSAHEASPGGDRPFFDGPGAGSLISFVTHRPKRDLSVLACGLVSLYEAGDPLCAAIFREELSSLAQDCGRLLRRAAGLSSPLPPVSAVLTGGFFESNPSVRRLFREILDRENMPLVWRETPADPTRAVIRHFREALARQEQEEDMT